MNYQITGFDITRYLKEHKDEDILKYRESMFARFIKIQKDENIKREILEGKKNLELFETFLKTQELDISGIEHIIVPTLAYYDMYRYSDKLRGKRNNIIDDYTTDLWNLKKKLMITTYKDYTRALDDYLIAELVELKDNYFYTSMDKDRAEKELEEYKNIYGSEVVEIVDEHIKKIKYRN